MTDRELLEMAAKAAGIEVVGPVEKFIAQPANFAGGLIVRNDRNGDSCWNPLTDDGDALRLAVKLGLCHLWQHDWLMIYSGDIGVREHDLTDPYAATRRAIVRAAAEIGRSMA